MRIYIYTHMFATWLVRHENETLFNVRWMDHPGLQWKPRNKTNTTFTPRVLKTNVLKHRWVLENDGTRQDDDPIKSHENPRVRNVNCKNITTLAERRVSKKTSIRLYFFCFLGLCDQRVNEVQAPKPSLPASTPRCNNGFNLKIRSFCQFHEFWPGIRLLARRWSPESLIHCEPNTTKSKITKYTYIYIFIFREHPSHTVI